VLLFFLFIYSITLTRPCMYVPMFDQIPKGHVRYCHDFVPVVAVRIHSHDSQALVSGKTNQGIINSRSLLNLDYNHWFLDINPVYPVNKKNRQYLKLSTHVLNSL
jgi:hypothetical protein